ncbi:hypothetical protein J1N35_030600 [Gossypium stocksii]|uniref:Uncharacterized protein n=1 Tax=Gossypium stocksii TaxID=47602 RepID=A0A9D3UZY8_9ROSI|nr:hypothetical protein J1N35_030600 [Gossypium stocksii]
MEIKQWNGRFGGNVDMKIDEIERKILEWNDIGSSRHLNEEELEEESRLNLELWDTVRFWESVWH